MADKELEAPFVVVGGGIAGVSCVEGLSFLKPDVKVILLTASPLIKATTNVTNLTKTLSQFDVEEKSASTLSKLYPSVTVINDSLKMLNLENHCLITEGGKTIKYNKLCLCTGGQPKLIAENNPNVLGLRDTESAVEFQKRITDARRILVVGNGGIATEIVYETESVEIVWAIKDKHISATFVDPGAAEFFQTRLQKKGEKDRSKSASKRMKYSVTSGLGNWKEFGVGAALGPDWHEGLNIHGKSDPTSKVTVEYECEVKQILNKYSPSSGEIENCWPIYAELTNGKVIGCDFIISATGVVPNCEDFVANKLELAEDGGIKVNWKMETSHPDVFAAGDVCTATWEKAEHWFQMRLWTQARQMGLYAAKCMDASYGGEPVVQDFCFELFSHVTRFFGYKVVLLGLYNGQKLGGEYEILLRMTESEEYIKLVMKDGRVQGAVLIGETDLEEMCENLILNKMDVSALGEDLLNPNVDIEDYFD